MLITDYLRSEHDLTWDYARQCGINHAVIRLPECADFNIEIFSHWKETYKRYTDFGIKPVVVEPIPNDLHDHIKTGDRLRDASIEKVIKMMEYMDISKKEPRLLSTVSCCGDSPRDFNIIGDMLVCANKNSDNVTLFKIVNSELKKLNAEIKIKSPFCVAY